MQRRRLLQLGLGAAVLVGVAGAGVALFRPGLAGARLTPASRLLMGRVAEVVLAGLLPGEEPARAQALQAQLQRVDEAVAALPAPLRAELSQALGLLATAPGRWALLGLRSDWPEAAAAELLACLEAQRLSTTGLRQQVYHALRDLHAIAFFTAPENWRLAGYPGPREI
ncbi:MAG: hypothetical protein DI603_03415 [Roseateles depolymerans]|uniref:Twin-arginine translocation pathway signal protein n=1 Tax=Roseateles depolymerans TaxID=76731 RepID=A0A2W5DYY8_9BURK|nr:MAG: hypothetical protein DI603_03415 [Roseateles depolymerans]